jgi:hypothetical protein
VPVDGGMTLPLPTVINVVERLKSSVVIPMHWFSDYALGRFLDEMSGQFAVDYVEGNSIEISLRSLPERPTIKVLRPGWLRDPQ